LRNGEVRGAELVVEERSLTSRRRVRYPFGPADRFPIQFREELRQRPAVAVHDAHCTLFDPKTGQLRGVTASTVQRRDVELRDRPVQVREITIVDGEQANAEWL